MVFKVKGDEALDAIVNVRLTSSEKERLIEDADLAGLSMSELIRSRYFGRKIVANSDEVMLRELRRLGGLLKHIHNESEGAYSTRTSAALVEVQKYIKKLSAK